MTTVELDAYKMQLIRDILAIDSFDALNKVRDCIRELLCEKTSFDTCAEGAHTVEEVLSDVQVALQDIDAGRVKSSGEVFREMEVRFPWLCE